VYDVPDAALAKGPRRLRCARCGTEWRSNDKVAAPVKPAVRWQPPAEAAAPAPAPTVKAPAMAAAPTVAEQPAALDAPPPRPPPRPESAAPAYAPPPPPPPPPAPPPPVFTAAPAPVFAADAKETDFTPAPAFTPAPPFTAALTYPAAGSYAAPADEPPAAPADQPFNQPPEPARTIEEERERQREAAARDAYTPLDDTIGRAWPPLSQGPTPAPSPEIPAETTYASESAIYSTRAPAPEEPARSVTGAPLPNFLIPDPTEEPPKPGSAPYPPPATADRFAELVYAARNRSIEFEPDALRERPVNRAPLLAIVLASVIVAVSILQYRSIEAHVPVTAGIFRAVGLR
jgi:hypothetical protein